MLASEREFQYLELMWEHLCTNYDTLGFSMEDYEDIHSVPKMEDVVQNWGPVLNLFCLVFDHHLLTTNLGIQTRKRFRIGDENSGEVVQSQPSKLDIAAFVQFLVSLLLCSHTPNVRTEEDLLLGRQTIYSNIDLQRGLPLGLFQRLYEKCTDKDASEEDTERIFCGKSPAERLDMYNTILEGRSTKQTKMPTSEVDKIINDIIGNVKVLGAGTPLGANDEGCPDKAPTMFPANHPGSWLQPLSRSDVMPEYLKAFDTICLSAQRMCRTKLNVILDEFSNLFDPQTFEYLSSNLFYDSCLRDLIVKAYGLRHQDESKIIKTKCTITRRSIFPMLQQFFRGTSPWRKPFFHFGLRVFIKLLTVDELVAKIADIIEHLHRCDSARQIGFNKIVVESHSLLFQTAQARQEVGTAAKSFAEAQTIFNEMLDEYIDRHKELAFRSAFTEPAKAYFHLLGEKGHENNVDTHGLNYYAVILLSCLHIRVPVVPLLTDQSTSGWKMHWHGGWEMDQVWAALSKPSNFGTAWRSIGELSEFARGAFDEHRALRMRSQTPNAVQRQRKVHSKKGFVRKRYTLRTPAELGGKVTDATMAAGAKAAIRVYLERFAFFFSKEFFFKKMFSTMIMEADPKYSGFSKVFQVFT
jgi:hypothetical protein